MAKTPAVIDDPYFQCALALAKGIAQQINSQSLSPLLLIAGLKLARDSVRSNLPAPVVDHWEEIERATSRLDLPETKIESLKESKFPLEPGLKKILSKAGASLEELVPALLEDVLSSDVDDEAFNTIVAYANSLGGQYGFSQITPEIFAASALAAFIDGHFWDRPALAAHILANKNYINVLLAEKGWLVSGAVPSDQKILPLGQEIVTSVKSSDTDKTIAAINVGVQIGSKLLSQRRTAYHEAGHAVVSSVLRPNVAVTEVNVISDGDAAGVTKYDHSSLPSNWRQEEYWDLLCVALAGRAAELIKFGPNEMDEGASSDLEKATTAAWHAISVYGLDHSFGPIDLSVLAKVSGNPGGWLFDRAQERLQEVLKSESERAENILRSNWVQVETVTEALLAKQKLLSNELVASLLEKGLTSSLGVQRARKRVVEREVSFAKMPGILDTLEGPVRYDTGDALVLGEKGERWPVKRHIFEEIYEPVKPIKLGDDGRYRGVVREVRALQLKEARRLDLANGRGILRGGAGDWVIDYGDGDMSIIAGDVFAETYELMDYQASQT